MITLWQIDSMNKANRKLKEVIDDPRVAAPIKLLCLEHSVPYYEGDPQKSFINLYRVIASRTSEPSAPGIPQAPDIVRGQHESHEQATCETLAASILDALKIPYQD